MPQNTSLVVEQQPKKKSEPKKKRSRRSEMCVYEGCAKRASFNLPVPAGSKTKNKPIYCGDHKTPEMVNVRCKVCVHPQCNRYPSFGYTVRKWCKTHRPNDAVNLSRSHCCVFEGCSKFPCWGDRILLKKRYCKAHALEGMVNVDAIHRLKRSKKLLQENPLYRDSTNALEKAKIKIKTLTLEKRYLRQEVKMLRDVLFKLNDSYKADITKFNEQNVNDSHHESANSVLIGESSWKLIKRVDNLRRDGFSDANVVTTSRGSKPKSNFPTSGNSTIPTTNTDSNGNSIDNDLPTNIEDANYDTADDNVMTNTASNHRSRTTSSKRKRAKDDSGAEALSNPFGISEELQHTQPDTNTGATIDSYNNSSEVRKRSSLGNSNREETEVSTSVFNIPRELQQVGNLANEDATNNTFNIKNKKQKASSAGDSINNDEIENDQLLEDGETLFL